MKKTIFAVLAAAVAINAEATSYIVSPAGDDGNDGTTIDSPFRTPQRCAEVARAGDTCYVRNGLYESAGTILTTSSSGNTGAPITFKSYPSETPVFVMPAEPSGVYGVYVRNDWIVVDGFRILGGDYGIVLQGAGHTQIFNNDVSKGYRGGVRIDKASSYNFVKGNIVHDNSLINWPRGAASSNGGGPGSGIEVADRSDNNMVEENYVFWNHGEGVVLGDGQHNIARRNVIADNWNTNLRIRSVNGVADRNFVYVSIPAKAWSSLSSENQSNSDGIVAAIEDTARSATDTVQITDNIVVNTRACIDARPDAPPATAASSPSSPGAKKMNGLWTVSNNTCVSNDSGITILNSTAGMSSLTLQNNIVSANGVGDKPIMQISLATASGRLRNNMYFGAGTSDFYWDEKPRGFAGWIALSREVHSSLGDPVLLDPTGVPPRLWDDPDSSERAAPLTALSVRSYSLAPSSPAIDTGVDFPGVFTSSESADRVSRRDIGALEFCNGTEPRIYDSAPGNPVCEPDFLPRPHVGIAPKAIGLGRAGPR